MNRSLTRREWLQTITAGSVVVSGGTVTGLKPTEQMAAAVDTESTAEHAVGRVLLKHEDTGAVYTFPSRDAIDWTAVPDGSYLLQLQTPPVEQLEQLSVQTEGTTASGGIEITAFAGGEAHDSTFAPGSTVPVFVGAIDKSGVIDRPAADPIDVEITITDPDGGSESFTEPIEDGFLRFEYETAADAPSGSYSVSVAVDDAAAASTFSLGRQVQFARLAPVTAPGREVTVPIDITETGTPADGIDVEIDVTYPDGTEQTETVTAADGLGTLTVTPTTAGTLTFESVSDTSQIEVRSPQVFVPQFALDAQRAGEPVDIAGHIQDDGDAVANQPFEITVFDAADDHVFEASFETDDSGFFHVSWPSDEAATQYSYELTTADGDEVLFSNTVAVTDSSAVDTQSAGPTLSGHLDRDPVAPGSTVTATVELEDGSGEPRTNEPVDVTVFYGRQSPAVPVESATLLTDLDGEGTLDVDVPAAAPDGSSLFVVAGATVDGTEETLTLSSGLAEYTTDGFPSVSSAQSGEDVTAGLSLVTADEQHTPATDVPVRAHFTSVDLHQDRYESETITTDNDGEGTTTATLPDSAQSRVGAALFSRYEAFSIRRLVQRFDATIAGIEEPVTSGDTLDLALTDADGTERTGFALLTPATGGTNPVVLDFMAPDDPASITVPHAVGGEVADLQLFAVDDGRLHRDRTFIQVTVGLAAVFEVTPTTPVEGAAITFDGTPSTAPDAGVSYEWDFTDDGIPDKTGQVVSWSYDEPGDYEVTLTVTDGDGDTDETTQTITVVDPLEKYRNPETGTIDLGGVRAAIGDWQAGALPTDSLVDVIDEWAAA